MSTFNNLMGATYHRVYLIDNAVNYGPWQILNFVVFSRLVEDSAGFMYSLR